MFYKRIFVYNNNNNIKIILKVCLYIKLLKNFKIFLNLCKYKIHIN